jgi:hypothetical protein
MPWITKNGYPEWVEEEASAPAAPELDPDELHVEVTLEKPVQNDMGLAPDLKLHINRAIADLNANEKTKRNWITVCDEIKWITPPLPEHAGAREVLYLDVNGNPGSAYVLEQIDGDVLNIAITDGW